MKTYVTKKEKRKGEKEKECREKKNRERKKRPGEVFNPAHTSLLTKSPHKFNVSNETQMKFGA